MIYFPEKLTLTWLRNAYRNKRLTPCELAEEILKRCEENNEKNIWITPPSIELMQKYIDKLPDDCNNLPLWGVPFAVKDNIDLENVPTTAACPDYSYIPEKSAYVVQKLIEAGAIPIGKTNLDQFATGLVGTRSPYGEVHNSLQPEMISGGSSSGSAVTVALGMAVFSLGTDTAGSGRVPAMLNNLVGLKPSLGSWSTNGVVPACASLDCVTVFANNLDDAKAVNSVAKSFDSECIWSRHYEDKGDTLPQKIYLPKEEPQFFGQFADIYRAKWNSAVERIEKLGNVEYIDTSIFSKAAEILYGGTYVAERWADLKDFVEDESNEIFYVTEKILRSGGTGDKTAAELFNDLHKLQKYRQSAKELLENAVLILPTAGGSFTRDEVRENPVETNNLMGLYTNHCNLLDLCAVAVPENTEDRTYPFGITVFGLAGNESMVMPAAERFIDSEYTEFAVCGLHKKDYPLEYQLTELGGEYIGEAATSDKYSIYKLDTAPVKPGLFKNGNSSITIELYRISKKAIGLFLSNVKSPLAIGDIELSDGKIVKGFLCESYALDGAVNISEKGGF